MALSAYLRLLIFLLAILIKLVIHPARHFPWCTLIKVKLKVDNKQFWSTPLSVLKQSVFPCAVLTIASCPTYRFLRRQLKWSGTSISLRIFHSLLWSTVKGFSIVNEADFFPGLPCFLHHPMNGGNLNSGSSVSLKLSLYIWKYSIHLLLKPNLKDFYYNSTSMWNEHNYTVVSKFFGIAPLWDEMKTDLS